MSKLPAFLKYSHRICGHCGPGEGRQPGGRPGQQVPGEHPPHRRHRPCGALLRRREHHARGGRRRDQRAGGPPGRHRDHRPGANHGGPGHGEPPGGEGRQGRQGRQEVPKTFLSTKILETTLLTRKQNLLK